MSEQMKLTPYELWLQHGKKDVYSVWLSERWTAYIEANKITRPTPKIHYGVVDQTHAEWLNGIKEKHRDAFVAWLQEHVK